MSNHNPPTNGFDKRKASINKNGRPKTFDAARALAQEIAHEPVQADGKDLVINGHRVTVTEAILRKWAQSKDPRLQMYFFEIAYGKVPNDLNLRGKDGDKLTIALEYVTRNYDQDTGLPPEPTDNQTESG
jgi:hypothetical protein